METKGEKNWFLLVIGSLILGFGVAVCNRSGLGADPITVYYDGIDKFLKIGLGNAANLGAFIFIVIVFFIDKTQLGLGTSLIPIINKFGIEFGIKTIPMITDPIISFVVFLFGCIILSIAIALTISANVGKSAYDALIISISSRLNKQYTHVRWVLDAVLLTLGLLLGSKMTYGTIVAMILIGKLIPMFLKVVNKFKKNIIHIS